MSDEQRAVDRVDVPECPKCQTNAHMSVVSRSEYVIYFRCAQCGHTQSVRKPRWNPDA